MGRQFRGEVVKRVGGPARARVIVLFGAVLALNGADTSTVGAVAPQLEHAFHIGNAAIGVLASVSLLIGAVFTIPVGCMVDRSKRVPILAARIVLWTIPGFFLARELWRTVPEPLRGGQSRLEPGVMDLHEAAAQAAANHEWEWEQAGGPAPAEDDLAHQAAQQRGVKPNPRLVLKEDPREMSLTRAIKYIVSIPTNVHLIISSSLGYFYFSGLSTFALLFVRGHYHASQATAELVLAALVVGGLIGTLVSGRVTDTMVRRGF